MPSFFFHILLDLDKASSRNTSYALSNKNHAYPVAPSNPKIEAADPFEITSNSTEAADSKAAISTSLSNDWRYDRISLQDFDMEPTTPQNKVADEAVDHITNGISAGPRGSSTKGRFEPLDSEQEELGWGVVRLWRDSEETPGLYHEPEHHEQSRHGRYASEKKQNTEMPFRDEDCTTLCILAVPSYLTPSDFLGFVGEKTRDEVSHIRMIRTERGNRYMVLMKFRNGKKAREWRREWNGKAFDSMEVSFLNLRQMKGH